MERICLGQTEGYCSCGVTRDASGSQVTSEGIEGTSHAGFWGLRNSRHTVWPQGALAVVWGSVEAGLAAWSEGGRRGRSAEGRFSRSPAFAWG